MKIILLAGFLGSGKTSMLKQLVNRLAGNGDTTQTRVAIIENEIGDINIDGLAMSHCGFTVRSFLSGCICCSLSSDLVSGVKEISEKLSPEYIIIEATGMAYPDQISALLLKYVSGIDNLQTILLADAERYLELSEMIAPLITGQIKQADIILLNKIDLVDDMHRLEVRAALRDLNSGAPIHEICARNTIEESVWEELNIIRTPGSITAGENTTNTLS